MARRAEMANHLPDDVRRYVDRGLDELYNEYPTSAHLGFFRLPDIVALIGQDDI